MPAQLIDKGQPDPGLLAQVVIAKCCDPLPLYRQQAIYHRAGVDIPRSAVLEGWQGTLVVDDYTGYKTLFTQPDIQEAACWAHVRRKFFDQFNVNKGEVAQEALNRIRALYQLERKVKHRKLANRQRWRQRYAKPALSAFYSWLLSQHARTSAGSGIYKAIEHTLKR
ncbi:transposase [Serratia symbiotica]|nr:transposase [Serratia symbiotica]